MTIDCESGTPRNRVQVDGIKIREKDMMKKFERSQWNPGMR
jgi:hypothetical protein